MKRLMLIVAALVLVCTGADAQGNLLKGIGQKALNKAENKVQNKVEKKVDQQVDKAVDKALDNIFGKKNGQNESSSAAYDEEPDYTFAGSLMFEDVNIDHFASVPEASSLPVYSYSDVVKYRPAWPSAADLANRDAFSRYAAKVQDYSLAAGQFITSDMTLKALMAMGQDNSYDQNVHSAKAQEIADELVKMNGERTDKLQNQAIENEVRSALRSGREVPNTSTAAGALSGLRRQIVAEWHRSAQCRKVNALQESGKGKAACVKEQCAQIDDWNKAQLERWVTALREWEDANCAYAVRLVELDAQLEALPEAEKKSPEYLIARKQANGLAALLLQWVMVSSEIFTCPYVEYPYAGETE